jgi:hypothetical protein
MPAHDGTPRPTPVRPEWFDKWKCLTNFVNVFSNHNITIIADGLDDKSKNRLTAEFEHRVKEIDFVNFGSNAETFLYSLDRAVLLPVVGHVYFVEDDYLHHEGADVILEQGLEKSPYVSLYDHPDKYWDGNADVLCKVFTTEDCHWRTATSTTMTFAAHVGYLRDDIQLFRKWCGGADRWTHDYQLFTEIAKTKGLITPLPGYSTHMDSWTMAGIVDWYAVQQRTTE